MDLFGDEGDGNEPDDLDFGVVFPPQFIQPANVIAVPFADSDEENNARVDEDNEDELHNVADDELSNEEVIHSEGDEQDEEDEDPEASVMPEVKPPVPDDAGAVPVLHPIATMPPSSHIEQEANSSPEQVIHYKIHKVSGGLSKHMSRFKPSNDLTVFEKNNSQYVILSLDKPAIVTKLNFDEKFLEKMLYAKQSSSSSGSSTSGGSARVSSLGHFRQPTGRLATSSTISMFWYVMKSIRFYGGLSEDCPLQLTATYTDVALIPLTKSADNDEDMVKSAFSRSVRQFEVGHTIAGRPFACAFIKLVIPNVSALISSAANYSMHGISGHSRSHGGMHPYSLMYRGYSTNSHNGHPNPATVQKQLVFFANAWRLFVTALNNQVNYYQQKSSFDGALMEITGLTEEAQVSEAAEWLSKYIHSESIRSTLKFFRENNLTGAYEALVKETGVQLEHFRMTHLYKLLVIDSNFDMVERFLREAHMDGLFEPYIRLHESYKPQWKLLSGGFTRQYSSFACFASKEKDPGSFRMRPEPLPPKCPQMRAGHSMLIDPEDQIIYMYGGFDGQEELSDLWMWDIKSQKWCELPKTINTPHGRSCQQMCIDTKRKRIYMLGRFVDMYSSSVEDYRSPFYVYDIKKADWTLMSENTLVENGPPLLIDHQMVIDAEKNIIYVFGGLIQTSESRATELSDFYAYDVEYDEWRLIRYDHQHLAPMRNINFRNHGNYNRIYRQFGEQYPEKTFYSRTSHVMMLHERQRKIYVIGGHRAKTYLRDVLVYDLDEDKLETWSDQTLRFPREYYSEGFTLRASLDPLTNEIFIFTSITGGCTNNGPTSSSGIVTRHNDPNNNVPDMPQHPAGNDGNIPNMNQTPPRGRLSIKNRFWVLDLKHRTLHSCYRNEKCYNGDGTLHQLTEFELEQILLNDYLGIDDEGDYIICNWQQMLGEPGGIAPLNIGIHDPLVINNIDMPFMGHVQARVVPAFIDIDGPPPLGGQVGQQGVPGFPNDLNFNSLMHLGGPSYNVIPQDPRLRPLPSVHSAFRVPNGTAKPPVANPVPAGRFRPRPRFAHQMTYDHRAQVHYLFGGNYSRNANARLNDFWSLKLCRLQSADIYARCLRLVRRQRYLDMLQKGDEVAAVHYLRTSLMKCYDTTKPAHKEETQRLIFMLFASSNDSPFSTATQSAACQFGPSTSNVEVSSGPYEEDPPSPSSSTPCLSLADEAKASFEGMTRAKLFNMLMTYFPEEMTQPKENLGSLVIGAGAAK